MIKSTPYEYDAITGCTMGTDVAGGDPSAYIRQHYASSFALKGCSTYIIE